ncbi:MAG: NADP-dependent oxidoreductase [Proteobacteria bacterium]|nr:NADP-dependent oxidoreductase [Pseudomonadota bacterium]MDA1057148.1 NADP-dependent oxidoreductase [Pseudomonadota bacterium]
MALPNHNRKVVLARRPDGMPVKDDFRLINDPVPEPGPGELLVRAHYLSADPFQRMRLDASSRYGKTLDIGDVIKGRLVGEVVRSNNADYQVGDFVEGMLGWQTYAISDGSTARAEYAPGITKVDPKIAPISAYLGILGFPGVTAYFALLEVCDPQAGETVVVTGAGGAVGSLAGQLAKIRGCRVVGIAGSDEKLSHIVDELGFDAGINYRTTPDLLAALRRDCPERIDVHFDNVGGDIAHTIVHHLARNARVVLVGNISQNNLAEKPSRPDVTGLLMTARAMTKGFIVYDWEDRADEARNAIAGWLAEGKIRYRETISEGIDSAPAAFISMLQGGNIGKQLIRLDDL